MSKLFSGFSQFKFGHKQDEEFKSALEEQKTEKKHKLEQDIEMILSFICENSANKAQSEYPVIEP